MNRAVDRPGLGQHAGQSGFVGDIGLPVSGRGKRGQQRVDRPAGGGTTDQGDAPAGRRGQTAGKDSGQHAAAAGDHEMAALAGRYCAVDRRIRDHHAPDQTLAVADGGLGRGIVCVLQFGGDQGGQMLDRWQSAVEPQQPHIDRCPIEMRGAAQDVHAFLHRTAAMHAQNPGRVGKQQAGQMEDGPRERAELGVQAGGGSG